MWVMKAKKSAYDSVNETSSSVLCERRYSSLLVEEAETGEMQSVIRILDSERVQRRTRIVTTVEKRATLALCRIKQRYASTSLCHPGGPLEAPAKMLPIDCC